MPEIIQTTGRRKTAMATIKFTSGSGRIRVNGREFEDYFNTSTSLIEAVKPLAVSDSVKKFDIEVKALGGGLAGQAGALSLAIARALCKFNPELPLQPEKGWFSPTRSADEGTEEIWSARRAQALPVLQALKFFGPTPCLSCHGNG